jgi:hypothetical protein
MNCHGPHTSVNTVCQLLCFVTNAIFRLKRPQYAGVWSLTRDLGVDMRKTDNNRRCMKCWGISFHDLKVRQSKSKVSWQDFSIVSSGEVV